MLAKLLIHVAQCFCCRETHLRKHVALFLGKNDYYRHLHHPDPQDNSHQKVWMLFPGCQNSNPARLEDCLIENNDQSS